MGVNWGGRGGPNLVIHKRMPLSPRVSEVRAWVAWKEPNGCLWKVLPVSCVSDIYRDWQVDAELTALYQTGVNRWCVSRQGRNNISSICGNSIFLFSPCACSSSAFFLFYSWKQIFTPGLWNPLNPAEKVFTSVVGLWTVSQLGCVLGQQPPLWLPPWPLPNVINIPNQWRKQGGSGRGCEHDLFVGFKQQVILCLHLRLTRTSDHVITANDARGTSGLTAAVLQNNSFQTRSKKRLNYSSDRKSYVYDGISQLWLNQNDWMKLSVVWLWDLNICNTLLRMTLVENDYLCLFCQKKSIELVGNVNK